MQIWKTFHFDRVEVFVNEPNLYILQRDHAFQALPHGYFHRQRTEVVPALTKPIWLHNFAPGDLYWVHRITINREGEWTAAEITLHSQVERTPLIMGVTVLPEKAQGRGHSSVVFVNTAELKDSIFGYHCHLKPEDQQSLQTGDIVLCTAVQAINPTAVCPYVLVSAEILHDVKSYQYPPRHLSPDVAVKRLSRLWLNLMAQEFALQDTQIRDQQAPGTLHWTQTTAPVLIALFKPRIKTGTDQSNLKLRVGEEVKIQFLRRRDVCYAIVDENAAAIGDMEFSLLIQGGAAVDLIASGHVESPVAVIIAPTTHADNRKRIQKFITSWPKLVDTNWASDRWKEIFQALFHRTQIIPKIVENLPADVLADPGMPDFVPNEDQLQVATRILTCTDPILDVLGPPGAGKTSLVVAVVNALLKREPEATVLICTASNKAANHVSRLLGSVQQTQRATEDTESGLRPLRIFATPLEQIQKSTEMTCALHALAETKSPLNETDLEELQILEEELEALHQGEGPRNSQFKDRATNLVTQITRLKKHMQGKFFDSYNPNVIITTCIGSADHRLEAWHPQFVIIDEISQALLIEALFACNKLSKTQGRQIILIGDYKQLAPVVLSVGPAGNILSTCTSTTMGESGTLQRYCLKRTYRLLPCILEFPNCQSYNNELYTLVKPADRDSVAKVYTFPTPHLPQVFYEVQGREEKPEGQVSRKNEAEVAVAVHIFQQLLQLGFTLEQIAILTFYEAQRRALVNRLIKEGILKSTTEARSVVANVDSFQGQERCIIILSCVRSNLTSSKTSVGFLKNERRANVALTRARNALIIIGNPGTLSTDKYWKSLVDFYSRNKQLVPYTTNNQDI